MPRENKKRGRREEAKNNKRKLEEADPDSSKRFKPSDEHEDTVAEEVNIRGDAGDDYIGIHIAPNDGGLEMQEEDQFHGLLDPQEQEYYSNVNTKIVANDFESDEDRAIFIEAVHRETEGKELKVASSQSCSRYLEKIILLSTGEQLRRLFGKFLGNFTYLVRHRFGSHCCETLFLEAAKHVGEQPGKREDDSDLPSTEDLFLQAAEEFKPNLGFLLTERFASHTIRVLFLVLSGESLDDESTKTILASKKKEKLDAPVVNEKHHSESKRRVPKSFGKALAEIIDSSVSSVDTTYLRALATHPTGNPVLQLLLRLELTLPGKPQQSEKMSLFKKLMPDEDLDEDIESAKFISGLIYDPVGSHLVEILVRHLSGKTFKKLYKNTLKPRLNSMVKNETASYVAVKILERLGKDDLKEAKEMILPELPTLISRRRLGLIRVLVERCTVRKVDLEDVAEVLKSGFGSDKAAFLPKLLEFETADKPQTTSDRDSEKKTAGQTNKTDVHGSLLGQAILQVPTICTLVQDSLLAVDNTTLVQMCRDPAASRLIQTAVTPSDSNMPFRRQFVPQFYGHIAEVAQDLSGSYVADALWSATDGLFFMKERLAEELANNASHVRESPFGKNVWRNWSIDMYMRRPGEWRALAKGYDKDQNAELSKEDTTGSQKKKSGLQLARERYAQKQARETRKNFRTPATSANATVVRTNA
ncbi:Nucleolar protein 9 [Exophiala xenobiotica]|nr:Nucleolar protein 9 [Exophiala xenobiotica]KAK5205868.1 Nucleolar protein 9 [Exophiala xenobiotica]KAK5217078.1 Nucleolar protein 9 [Exophiala xenobiotica]KAK5225361.1 Nucleolar protein 9 [Exophiala xenobiotica]KAK5249532.1 Nucleolar protein 9 [Exophiala xenobiotica]